MKNLAILVITLLVATGVYLLSKKEHTPVKEKESAATAPKTFLQKPAADTLKPAPQPKPSEPAPEPADSAFVRVIEYIPDVVLDLRYATTNNFMEKKVYPCAECLLRYEAVKALKKAQEDFKTKGYKIKIFDGYRPLSVQWKLWNSTDKKQYVANPKYGSNHNRGCAVDLTLVDSTGRELDMGTDFDFFGKKAHHSYTNLPQEVLENRRILKTVLAQHGFSKINSEWWHYNYKTKYPVSDAPLPCE